MYFLKLPAITGKPQIDDIDSPEKFLWCKIK